MQMQVNKGYGSILFVLLYMIAPGLGTAAYSQNNPVGAQGQYLFGHTASITASGGYIYLQRGGRLYQLRSSGLSLASRKDVAPNSGHVAGAKGRSSADGGYNISVEGGFNGSGSTANSQSTPRLMRNRVPEALTVGGTMNEGDRSNPNGLTANGKHNSGQNSVGNFGAMATGMNANVKAIASGDYVYVLNGSMLYQMRAATMKLVSHRNLSTIDTDAIMTSGNSNGSRTVSRRQ